MRHKVGAMTNFPINSTNVPKCLKWKKHVLNSYIDVCMMVKPEPYRLLAQKEVHQLLEQRTSFNLNRVELNVYETRERFMDYRLRFGGFTITSMLRGKKNIRIGNDQRKLYLPGNTVLAPTNALLSIDFPEARMEDPTQCSALTIEDAYLLYQVNYFNEYLPKLSDGSTWKFDETPVLLNNNRELATLNNRIIQVLSSGDPFKDIHADLLIKELVLCVLRLQHVEQLAQESHQTTNHSPLQAVLHHIRTHITSAISVNELCRIACMSRSVFYRTFVNELGIAPNQLIIRERLELAKRLLQAEYSVKEAGYAAGFTDINYFVRSFRCHEGKTPGEYKKML